MKKILVLLLFICLFISCKKSTSEEENYTVTGQVLDLDSKLPIVAAKVYTAGLTDSALTDAAGRVSFKFTVGSSPRIIFAVKDGYLRPNTYYLNATPNISRIDTFYLARPSFVNVTIHKTGTYQISDTVEIQVAGDNIPSIGETAGYRVLHRDKTNAPDKLYNLQAAYNVNYTFWSMFLGHEKLYFIKKIIRNGSVISSNTDSTSILQFATQNVTLNY